MALAWLWPKHGWLGVESSWLSFIFASVEEPGGSQRLSRLVVGCEGDRNREADL